MGDLMQNLTRTYALGYVLLSRVQRRIAQDSSLSWVEGGNAGCILTECMHKVYDEFLVGEGNSAFWVNFHWRYNATMDDI